MVISSADKVPGLANVLYVKKMREFAVQPDVVINNFLQLLSIIPVANEAVPTMEVGIRKAPFERTMFPFDTDTLPFEYKSLAIVTVTVPLPPEIVK